MEINVLIEFLSLTMTLTNVLNVTSNTAIYVSELSFFSFPIIKKQKFKNKMIGF